MSTPAKRKSSGQSGTSSPNKPGALSPHTIEYLRAWMMSPDHIEHPYPTEKEKVQILSETGITSKQLTCWFSNNRKRFWKPKMEEMGKYDVVEAAMGSSLSPQTIDYLKAWMLSPGHIQNPYPTEEEKAGIMAATGIEKKQLTCWFSNNRKRFWKPKMDNVRKQYGLKDDDPLPPAALAAITAPTPISPATDDPAVPPHGYDMLGSVPVAAPSGNMLNVIASETALSGPFAAPLAEPSNPAVAPVAELPLEGFSSGNLYGSAEDLYASMNVTAEATADEAISMEQADIKRQKVSFDGFVEV